MSANDLVIDVQGITKRFGNRTVVNNIPMQVHPIQHRPASPRTTSGISNRVPVGTRLNYRNAKATPGRP